ncbi:MAG: hypothetical protein HUJ72_11290 [Blautia sp.]|nr:hypothetical protein [Blautia sp.]
MEMERIVKKFYDGLEEGVLYARKCLECGAIEFPPHYACNTCGYHATEWTTVSGNGMLKSIIMPAPNTARPEIAAIAPYCFGEIELVEGPAINGTVLGITKKKAKELQDKLPLPVKGKITQMDGYKILFFELDE